jgi:hypothetical protein
MAFNEGASSCSTLLANTPASLSSALFMNALTTVASTVLQDLWAQANMEAPRDPVPLVQIGLQQFNEWPDKTFEDVMFAPMAGRLTTSDDKRIQQLYEEFALVRITEIQKTLKSRRKRLVNTRIPVWREFIKLFMRSLVTTSEIHGGAFFSGMLSEPPRTFLLKEMITTLDTRIFAGGEQEPLRTRTRRAPTTERAEKRADTVHLPLAALHIGTDVVAKALAPKAPPVRGLPPMVPRVTGTPPPDVASAMQGTGVNLLDKLGDVGVEDSVSVAFAKRMGMPQPEVVEEPAAQAPQAFASQAGSVQGSTRLADKVRTVDAESVVSGMTRGVLELPTLAPAANVVGQAALME